MRTTLTIDEPIVAALQDRAHRTGKSYEAVVNEALRLGLHAVPHPPARPYVLTPSSLGKSHAGTDLDRALGLTDLFDNDAMIQKLALRK